MKRYTEIEVIKKAGQRRYSETVRYPLIPPSIGDTYIVARTGDRLDNLAYEYYKDPSLWWILARANTDVDFKGNMSLPTGTKLIIPTDVGEIISDLERINRIRQ